MPRKDKPEPWGPEPDRRSVFNAFEVPDHVVGPVLAHLYAEHAGPVL